MRGLAGVVAVVAGLAGASLHAVNDAAGRSVSPSFWLMQCTAAIGYGTLAWLLRSRTTTALRASVGVVALCQGLGLLANEIAVVSGSSFVTWVGSWLWAPGYVAIVALLPGLLPDGQVVSPRWRPGVWLGVAAVVLAGLSWAVTPYELQDYTGPLEGSTNPVGTDLALEPVVAGGVLAVIVGAVVVAAASLVVRWRRSIGVVRQQLKWVLLGVGGTLVVIVVSQLLPVAVGETLAAVAMVPLPAAIGVAVLRHGLWDVEVVVSRSVGYAAVSLSVVVAYLAVVGLAGLLVDAEPWVVSVVAVALVAPLAVPVHGLLRRRVNRWIHGDDDEPVDVLARVGNRLAAASDPAELVQRVLPSVLDRLRVALRASLVELRLDDGTVLRDGAAGVAADGWETVAMPLRYGGVDLGRLSVSRAGGFGASELRLLDRLATQAAVAVHTVHLARETQRSRELVVTTREEERRRLRHDLHDGVGPSLAALALQIETARDVAVDDPGAAVGILDRLAPRMNALVADVRSLVHELRPPTLDELGLAAAVRELTARLSAGPVTVTTHADGLGDLPAAVEVAAYRIVGEAVTNAVRHADATAISVQLATGNGHLVVWVRDDGHGVTGVPATAPGLGLSSMRARAEELGGDLDVESGPDGTVVTASLPTGGGA